MKTDQFLTAFNTLRRSNLGKFYERRELGMLFAHQGIALNNSYWQCGLDQHFVVTRMGRRYVYSFKDTDITLAEVQAIAESWKAYRNNITRKIENAKKLLRKYNVTSL